jgi:hypothetical protein
MAIIKSVSIDKRQDEFISSVGLSLSGLLQTKINELMTDDKVSKEDFQAIKKNMGFLQGTIKKQGTFIDKHGLMQEYLQFEDV